MKQTKSILCNFLACWRIGKILGTIAIFLFNFSVQGTLVTGTITNDGIMLTWSYNNVVCLGTLNTITFTLENTNTTPFANNIILTGFTPDGTQPTSAGLSFVSAVPPQPSGVITFDPTSAFMVCNFCTTATNCPAGGTVSEGQGNWVAASSTQPLANGIPYTFTITYQATACGIQTYFGELQVGTVSIIVSPPCPEFCKCFDTISILVIPFATLSNTAVVTGLCNNDTTGITGTLPPPLCPSGSCTGPLVNCSIAECSGCTGGPFGPFPFQFSVSGITGGTVTLLDPTAGVFQFVPDPTFMGTGEFSFNVTSETTPPQFCSPTSALVFIESVIQIPLTTPATFSGCGNGTITGNLANFVTGGSNSFTFSGPLGPPTCGTVTIPPNGMFTFTAPSGAASCMFAYQATDNTFGCVGTGSVTVNVTQPPTGTPASFVTCINTPVSGTLAATGGTPPFTFAISTPPANGMITMFDPTTGNFTYTPNAGFTGTDTFQFIVTDSQNCMSLPATITIMVIPQPVTSSTSFIGCENTTITGSLTGLVTGGTGTQIFSVSGPSVQACGIIQIFADGTFNFIPTNMFTGTCNFAYQVSQGGCSGTGPDTITITIEPAPIATGAVFNVCQFGNVTGDLNNFVISTTGNTSFTAVGGPTNGVLTLNPSGPFSFTATIASGTAGFKFEVLSSVLPCPSATEMVTVNVHPNPKVTTGTKAVCSNTATSGNLVPLVQGSPPFTFTGPFTSVNGTTTINPNGIFTFTPAPAVTGGSFTFGVTDVFGCKATGTELITVNPSPTASNQSATGCSNGKATGSVAGSVTGGTPGYIFQVSPPVVGGMALVSSNGNFTFMPNPGATAGSFNFKATDMKGCMAVGTVNVTINPAPSTMTGHFTGCNNGFTGSLAPLVTGTNPPFTFSGPIGPVVNGSVMVDASGNFFFNPSGLGPASFNFDVTDSAVPPCTSNVTPVQITIEQGPVALPATFDTCENVPFTASVASGLANFVSGGLPPFMFFQTGPTPACAAILMVNPDGSFNFTPALNFTGPCPFNWQVKDSTPCLSNISTATINVHPTPVANNSGPFPACEFDPFTGDLNAFMTVGTPPFTGFTGDNPINGTINFLLPTGPFSFTPASVGLASFTFSAIDAFGCHSNTGVISFNAAESPVITSPSPLDVCSNSMVISTATATGSVGIQPFTFTITNVVNGTAVIIATTPTSATFKFTPNVTVFPTPTVEGSVTIRATAAQGSTSQGCFDETTVIINIHQAPIITITGVGSCTGTFTGSLAPFVTGGIPPFIFGPVGIVPTTPSGCGTVILDVFGNFEFIANPPTAFPCPCTFDFTVTESSVSHCTSTGSVAVCVSQPPIASNVSVCQCIGVPTTLLLSAFVTGGKPPFTFMIVGTPIGGKVILLNPATGLVVFIPNPGFSGFAEFQFKVTDSNVPPCTSNIATVTIQIPCCPSTGLTGT